MARDLLHNEVKIALEKDGWIITHDPLTLKWGTKDLFVDLGAEQLLAAEKIGRKIAVEVKSFLKDSFIYEFYSVLGQYLVYQEFLARQEPDRQLM